MAKPKLEDSNVQEQCSEKDSSCLRAIWSRDKLMIFIIISVLLGFLIGILSNPKIQDLNRVDKKTALVLLGFPGELLMRMLKMLILPLIVSSLIVGLADLDQSSSGKLGRRAILYYMGTTLIAVLLGIVLVVSISPGRLDNRTLGQAEKDVRPLDSILDLIRNMFPPNIIQATLEQTTTNAIKFKTNFQNYTVNMSAITTAELEKLKEANNLWTEMLNDTHNHTYYQTWDTEKVTGDTTFRSGTNILGLVVFSIVFGLVLGKMGERADVFTEWMSVLNDVVMELVSLVMWYSPIGICSLISAKFAEMDDIGGNFERLGLYMTTVIVGLMIHSLFILPAVYLIVTRRNPLLYLKGILQALLTAFGTASSSATLPITFRCLEVNNNVDRRITRFVLPIGATINMDGTALYEAVAAIFIAQSTGASLSIGEYIAISITATLASIGAAGIPQAGLVTMLIVLQTVGLPEEGVSLIIAVDWFLDRIRTAVNVMGDCIGAGIVDHLSRHDLQQLIPPDSESSIGKLNNALETIPEDVEVSISALKNCPEIM